MNLTQAASIINQMAYELEQDNDRAERARKLEAMVAQVKAQSAESVKRYKKTFPNGTALTIAEEIEVMRSCFPMVAVNTKGVNDER